MDSELNQYSQEEELASLGYNLPESSPTKELYIPVKQAGNILYISGQIPFLDDRLYYTGKVGDTVSLEQAQEVARICILNMLSAVKYYLGDLSQVKEVVKIQAFISSAVGFEQQHIVANAASQLLYDVFGEQGRHERTAVGTNQLPLDTPVEIEAIFEVND